MKDKKFQAKDKIVNQMTKDGLAEVNLFTGETENISSKETDISFVEHEENLKLGRDPVRKESHTSKRPNNHKSIGTENSESLLPLSESNSLHFEEERSLLLFEPEKSRLIFTEDELEIDNFTSIVKRPPDDGGHAFDGDSFYNQKFKTRDKTSNKLSFKRFENLGRNAFNRFTRGTYRNIKQELRKNLDDNTSVETSNTLYDLSEHGAAVYVKFHSGTRRNFMNFGQAKISKLHNKINNSYFKSENARIKLSRYENSSVNSKSLAGDNKSQSKSWQKKRLQRKYSKAIRENQKTIAKLEKFSTSFSYKYIYQSIRKLLQITSTGFSFMFALLGILIFVIFGLVALIVIIWLVISLAISSASYLSEEQDIHDSSVLVTQLEAELDKQIQDVPIDPQWAHIDEFRYNIDTIGHNPFVLMAWLTTKYEDFTFDNPDVQRFLGELHNARYDLQFDEEVEVRERTYEDDEGNEYTEEYDWYILNVTLISKTIEEIINPEMELDESNNLRDHYDTLMETKGLHQAIANPFDIDWSASFSSLYGYRVNPLDGNEIQFHRGFDIPMPTGTPIRAGVTGTVIEHGYNDTYGNYIVLEDKKSEWQVKYAHCDQLNLSSGAEVKSGETIIGTVGNTGGSTGSHLHIETKQNGEYLNPIYLVDWDVAT